MLGVNIILAQLRDVHGTGHSSLEVKELHRGPTAACYIISERSLTASAYEVIRHNFPYIGSCYAFCIQCMSDALTSLHW